MKLIKNSLNSFKSFLIYAIIMTPNRRIHLPKKLFPIKKETISFKAGKNTLEPDIYYPKTRKRLPALIIYCPLALEGKDDKNIVNFLNGVARMGYFAIVPVWLKREAGQIEPDDDKELEATFDYLLQNKKVDPKRISILGISYGGGVALKFANNPKYKDKIKSLILIGSSLNLRNIFDFAISKKIKGKPRKPTNYLMYMVVKTICRHLEEPDRSTCLKFLKIMPPYNDLNLAALKNKISKKNFELLSEIVGKKPNKAKIEALLPKSVNSFINKFDSTKDVPSIRQEIIAFHSSEDTMVPVTESEKIVKLAKKSRFYTTNSFEHTVPKQATLKTAITMYLPSFFRIARFTKDIFDFSS